MARTRNISHKFFLNDELATLSPYHRLLFIGLWTIADREGRIEDRPKRIKASLFPYEDCTPEVDTMLHNLEDLGFIERYEVNGEKFLQVLNFAKYQRPHPKECESEIPEKPGKATAEPNLFPAKPERATEKPERAATFPSIPSEPSEPSEPSHSTSTRVDGGALKTWFDSQFWKTYPRRVGKTAAWRAMQRASPDAETRQRILDAIKAQEQSDQWMRDGGQFIPHPATWINQGRWDDEPVDARASPVQAANALPVVTRCGFCGEFNETPPGQKRTCRKCNDGANLNPVEKSA